MDQFIDYLPLPNDCCTSDPFKNYENPRSALMLKKKSYYNTCFDLYIYI